MAQAVKRGARKPGEREMLRSTDPRTGEVLGETPANTVDEMRAAVRDTI
jgi:acyl-CoA reductase-like NAD-dependent aldehyde dehydrogenase